MYHPVIESKFKEVIEVKNGKFEFDRSYAARKYLAMHINDNVLKNLSQFSLKPYDTTLNYSKSEFTKEEKEVVVKDFLTDHILDKDQLNMAVDRILVAHRNTKLFLFFLSGPFFIMFSIVKYAIKLSIFYFLIKGRGSKKTEEADESK